MVLNAGSRPPDLLIGGQEIQAEIDDREKREVGEKAVDIPEYRQGLPPEAFGLPAGFRDGSATLRRSQPCKVLREQSRSWCDDACSALARSEAVF